VLFCQVYGRKIVEMNRRRTRSDGDRSRERILETATRLATVEGLHGLSIARLARATGMSKSGVYGLFGSKEELQLATIEAARRVFVAEVIEPSLAASSGVARLLALCEGYLDYVGRRVWPGGCFFASVASEVASRPGPVHDRIAEDQRQWVELLAGNARRAEGDGVLAAGEDPQQLALELSTMLTGADIAYLLHEDPSILDRVRTGIRSRVSRATDRSL
jgi:AcrR family transcriptional regulator